MTLTTDQSRKIFIADDDPVISLLLESTLNKWGFEILKADNGVDAQKILLEIDTPLVLLLDWHMPGINGIEVLKTLRKERPEVPHYVIMLTSRSEKNDIISALEAGADNFISKPFDPDELKAHITVGTRFVSMHLALTKAVNDAKRLADSIAHYDQTTGLPNRVFLRARLEEAISSGNMAALFLINIDRFKIVNQARGIETGDLLLNYVGVRLQSCFAYESVIARFAADEFGILTPTPLDNNNQPADISDSLDSIAQKIHIAMEEEFTIDDGIKLTVSIGAAPVQCLAGEGPDDVIRKADTALRKAKHLGGNCSVIYDERLEEEIREKFAIENELMHGIENHELRLFLQAQVDARGNFTGAEALIRWYSPKRGIVPPMIFIPVAEETDLVFKIGNWVLNEVCKLISQYPDYNFTISVNISPRHFCTPDFASQVTHFIKLWGIPGNRLVLEVTEGLLIANVDDIANKMRQLAELGIRFSIDDFGTGYSSLAYIKRLPIAEIKIDRQFVLGIPDDENDCAIVKAVFHMASALGLSVVAEGVETLEQADYLNRIGTILHQGYYFCKPGPADQILKTWLTQK